MVVRRRALGARPPPPVPWECGEEESTLVANPGRLERFVGLSTQNKGIQRKSENSKATGNLASAQHQADARRQQHQQRHHNVLRMLFLRQSKRNLYLLTICFVAASALAHPAATGAAISNPDLPTCGSPPSPSCVLQQAAALQEWGVNIRRQLHRQPELMYEEESTSALVQQVLTVRLIPKRTSGSTGTNGNSKHLK